MSTHALPVDLPQGVAEFIGHAASRGVVLPLDFVAWLSSAPKPLDFEQCTALHLSSRAWSALRAGEGGGTKR